MEEQMNSRRELEAQLHDKETQKMEEFRSKVNFIIKDFTDVCLNTVRSDMIKFDTKELTGGTVSLVFTLENGNIKN